MNPFSRMKRRGVYRGCYLFLFILLLPGMMTGVLAEVIRDKETMEKVKKTEDSWKKELTPEQYRVLREKGTEQPFTGEHWDNHREGKYVCAACGMEIFSSEHKFDSGTGWPSFFCPVGKDRVATNKDESHGMVRTEVICPRCGGHLGHVFDDGPPPTYERYCMNSAALKFVPKEEGS